MPSWDPETIYSSFSRMVYWTACGILKDESDAADITQEVFLRVMKHIKKLKDLPEPQLKGWLYRVAYNLCMDRCRKLKHELVTDELPDMPVEDTAQLPEDFILDAEDTAFLRRAVTGLPDIYRQTVVLHYFSQLKYEEIAALQGCSVGTVKSRMSRAKARLYETLKGGDGVGQIR